MGLTQTKNDLIRILNQYDDTDPILGLLEFIAYHPESVKEFVDLYHNKVVSESKLNRFFEEFMA